MRIAVCITNITTVSLLSQLFDSYQVQKGIVLYCTYFENDIELLCRFATGSYDILFFGGPESNRMAEEIREKDGRIHLVCVAPIGTDTVYDGKELWYRLPEPMDALFLFPVLDRLAVDIHKNKRAGLVIKTRGTIIHLLFSQIEYVEVMGRTIQFHLADERVEEVPGTFSDYEARLLQWPDFVKVHRAYIINLQCIYKLTSNGILTQNGHMVPVSRHLYPQFKKDYLCGLMIPVAEQTEPQDVYVSAEGNTSDSLAILLVDDDPSERQRWSSILTDHNCIVQTASDDESAVKLAEQAYFDCVILDVCLGNSSGFDLCDLLKNKTGAPVVYLSTLADSEHQLRGFSTGGIDYITKDTSPDLFWAKIETRIKLAKSLTSELCVGRLRLDLKLRTAYLREQLLPLTTVEFDILYLLMQNPGTVYSPAHLYELIWGTRQSDDGHTVSLHLSQICRKLESVNPSHIFIEIVWGTGYRFIPE